MIYIALWFKVFLRPTELSFLVFKWVDLLPAVTDGCVLADCVFDMRLWRGRSRALLRGSGTGQEGGFVFLWSFSFSIFNLWKVSFIA
jgi:hypothetical protein